MPPCPDILAASRAENRRFSAADHLYYSVQSILTAQGQTAGAEFTFTLTAPPANLESLNLTLATQEVNSMTQFVYLYNFKTNVWDVVFDSTGTTDGPVLSQNIPVDLTKYVGPGNVVKVVNRGVRPTRLNAAVFKLNTDQATLTEGF